MNTFLDASDIEHIQKEVAAFRKPGSYEPGKWSVSHHNRNPRVLGKEAEKLGMINRAVPEDRLEPEVMTMAREIARLPLDFIACNKLGVNRFFEEMGVKKAVEESLTIHAFGSMFKQREELIRASLDKGGAPVTSIVTRRFC